MRTYREARGSELAEVRVDRIGNGKCRIYGVRPEAFTITEENAKKLFDALQTFLKFIEKKLPES